MMGFGALTMTGAILTLRLLPSRVDALAALTEVAVVVLVRLLGSCMDEVAALTEVAVVILVRLLACCVVPVGDGFAEWYLVIPDVRLIGVLGVLGVRLAEDGGEELSSLETWA